MVEPKKKASALVSDVIEMDGPACLIPMTNRSFAELVNGTWSMALAMTNISSTPIPINKNGIKLCTPLVFPPNANMMPKPEKYDSPMHNIPIIVVKDLQCIGLQDPKNTMVYKHTKFIAVYTSAKSPMMSATKAYWTPFKVNTCRRMYLDVLLNSIAAYST